MGNFLWGEKIGKIKFAGCNLFWETVVNGRVCYETGINLHKLDTPMDWNEVLQRGVGFVIDTGEEFDVRNLLEIKESGEASTLFRKSVLLELI